MISSNRTNRDVAVAVVQNVVAEVARVPAAEVVVAREGGISGVSEEAAAAVCKGAEIAVASHDHTPGYE